MRNRDLQMLLAATLFTVSCASAPVVPAVSATDGAPSSVAAGHGETNAAAVTARLEEIRLKHRLPALVAVAVRPDDSVQVFATGFRQQGRPERVEKSDRFHLGSMSKAITATVIARLVEEGKLSWSTRPVDVFPELAASIHPQYREVTLDQLLRHRAGTPPYRTPAAFARANRRWGASGDAPQQRRAFSVALLQRRPHKTPGAQFDYSNSGYAIAAAMAETTAAEPWEQLMESRLAAPLGIRIASGWPALTDAQQPWGHKPFTISGVLTTGKARPQAPDKGYLLSAIFGPAGDYAMSLDHYARFMQLHLAGLAGRDGVLKASSIQYLHSGDDDYLVGWWPGKFGQAVAHTHTGGTGVFTSRVTLLPAHAAGAAAMTNSGNIKAAAGLREAVATLLHEYRGQ